MQTASFTGLVKTIFWFLAFYYIFKFLARLFLPVIAKKVVDKAQEQFNQQYQNHQQEQQDSYNQSQAKNTQKPHETKKVGEYIDYEEVE